MDMFAGWYGCLDRVEESDIFLVPVLLHALTNNFAIQHVEGGKQRGRAMPLMGMPHETGMKMIRISANTPATLKFSQGEPKVVSPAGPP